MKNLVEATKSGFLGQPKALGSLFIVELWERFGFYAVQGILILYLTKIFHLSDDNSYDVLSIASAFIYATPFIGGYLADKILGYRKSVLLGAALLSAGYWLMMIPNIHMLYWALALLIIGNGFFKSCISTLVGLLYSEEDTRRDAGFTIFYMGINIGSFTGPLASGYLSTHLGWPFAFGFAGVGLIIAIGIAVLTFKKLGDIGLAPAKQYLHLFNKKISTTALVYLGTAAVVFVFGALIEKSQVANIIFSAVCFGCVIGVIVLALRCQGRDRTNMLVLIILILFSIIFWAIYNQTFSSLSLFTDRIVDRNFMGNIIPTAAFQSVNPFFIIALTPFFVKLWPYLAQRKSLFSTGSAKFASALFWISLGFLILVIGIKYHAQDGKVAMFWLILSYFFQTVGELFISPIGLSLVSKLAPSQYRGMMMGGWLLSTAAGYSLGDYLAKFSSVPDDILKTQSLVGAEHYYAHAFTIFMVLAFVGSIALWLLVPTLNKSIARSRELHRRALQEAQQQGA